MDGFVQINDHYHQSIKVQIPGYKKAISHLLRTVRHGWPQVAAGGYFMHQLAAEKAGECSAGIALANVSGYGLKMCKFNGQILQVHGF